jgi:hypothetical protein
MSGEVLGSKEIKLIDRGWSVGEREGRRIIGEELEKLPTWVARVFEELQEAAPPSCVSRTYMLRTWARVCSALAWEEPLEVSTRREGRNW